ncbi:PilZ domain-containing protein [Oribacterium sp. WCC10]|uniref:PilZ domain-containing protein n=1 Tax=Oribacterium sp. WCC10 TaxID=1855343 RepID=UPI0008F0E247|nr:PilZ domain-containing protein [Oribacterium sp. WCC10]SFG24347.1 PilZ domain-containing protein [Oribacterium sp. WCC10]
MILKDCNNGIVKFENDEYRVRVVTGLDNNVALYFKEDNGLKDMWMKNAEVSFNDSVKGLIRARCDIMIHENPGFPIMPEFWLGECEIKDVIEIVQRQQDIRVNVSLSVQFTSETADRRPFFGTIINLSAGGIYMVTSESLTIGEELTFHYTFKNTERPFRLKVLWGKLENSGANGYGLQFMNLTEGAETAIRGYVFRELREQRLRNNGGR